MTIIALKGFRDLVTGVKYFDRRIAPRSFLTLTTTVASAKILP